MDLTSRTKIFLIKFFVKRFLPSGIFVGNYMGAYTQKEMVHFGRMDSRGVLQGIEEKKIFR